MVIVTTSHPGRSLSCPLSPDMMKGADEHHTYAQHEDHSAEKSSFFEVCPRPLNLKLQNPSRSDGVYGCLTGGLLYRVGEHYAGFVAAHLWL